MIPSPPPRRTPLGFLYLPPYRLQGISVAGEQSAVHVPEMDLCFDIGLCPRVALSSRYVALTHGHMDHVAGISYYFSQRHFQGMGTGIVCCPKPLADPIHKLMNAWVAIENQRTPYELVAMDEDDEVEIKPKLFLRAFTTAHTVPSLGYVVVEKRTKLKPELVGMPQEQIVALKRKGEEVTYSFDVPQIVYTGDTMWSSAFDREDVLNAKILVTECTFMEQDHRRRASVGRHLHLNDIVKLLSKTKAEAVVLTHLSRRTHIGEARKQIDAVLSEEDRKRVFVLMDTRSNRMRYDDQKSREESEMGG